MTTFWPNRFGHTHYTDALIDGMRCHRPERHLVAAEGHSEARETERYRSVPCWHRGGDYVDNLADQIRTMGAELVICQYSEDLYGNDERMPRLLRRLTRAQIHSVVVYHSTYPGHWKCNHQPGGTIADFDRALATAADCIVVHSARMRLDLLQRGVPAEKVVVIPHGSKPMVEQDRGESRRQLGLPVDVPVVLFFGFIWLGKGLDFLLDAFGEVARRVPDAWLYVGGHTRHKRILSLLYMSYLRGRLRWLRIHRRTRMWGDYVPDAMVPTIYSAADVVAMPYRQNYSSSSGVVHQTAGMGKLMLCSRIAKFDEVAQFISPDLVVGPWDRHGWVDGLTRLLTDQDHARRMRAQIRAFGEQTSWEAVARLHIRVHDAIASGKPPSSTQDPKLIAEPPRLDYRPEGLYYLLSRHR